MMWYSFVNKIWDELQYSFMKELFTPPSTKSSFKMHRNCTSGLSQITACHTIVPFFLPDFGPIRKKAEHTWEVQASPNLSATPWANHSSGLPVGVTHECHPLIAIMWCFWLYGVHPHYHIVVVLFFSNPRTGTGITFRQRSWGSEVIWI